ncbi:MAG: PKD domain-containing protein [Candidatus Marinimicrobia bacterium]|nr:PKD domain-containing protein [Candidatus Neomarinimicrobiota bacterium]
MSNYAKIVASFFLLLFVVCPIVNAAPYSEINLITNGGFESGSLSSWSTTTSGYGGLGGITSISASTTSPQSGSYDAEFYKSAYSSGSPYGWVGVLYQDVNFDSAGSTLTVYTHDAATNAVGKDAYTSFYMEIGSYGSGGGAGDLGTTYSGDANYGRWVAHTIDLSTYCGGSACTGTQTVRFFVQYGSWRYGYAYIDTVSLQSTSPTADFTATPLKGKAPLSVTFTNSDTHTTAYEWDFGDGGTSTDPNPTHSYTSAGTSYTVIHKATNLGGYVTSTKTNYITTNATLTADFTATPTSGVTPLSVTFTDTSTGSPAAWNWSFGDGQVSNTHNPTHSYTSAGTYTVRLDVTNPDGTTYVTKTNLITVAGVAPHAGMAIGGRIYDAVSAGGLNLVQMTLVNTTSSWVQSTYTNVSGYYVFNNLSTSLSSNYVLSGVKSGYLDTSTSFSLTASDVTASYKDVSFGMEVIGSSADQGVGGRYAPNLVRFTVKHYWSGEPIADVNVTAQGFETTAGSGTLEDATTMLGSLFGFDFVTSPIQSTLMAGETGSDGSITFWMVENVKYHITFEKGGVEITSPLTIYPKEYEYLVPVTGTTSPDQGATTNSTFTSDKVNTTYSYINVSYSDTAFKTTMTKLVISKIVNSSTETEVYTKTEFGYASSTFDASYIFESEVGDQYYVTLTTDHTDFGEKSETKLITIPGRQLDLRLENTDYYSWIALALIYLVAQMGGSKRTRDVSIAMTLFAGFMWISGWLPISTLLMQAALMFAILYYTRTAEDQ